MPASRRCSTSSPPRPKMKGSPPLRRTTLLAFAHGGEHQLLDEGLRRGAAAAALAHMHDARGRPGVREDGRVYQVVDQQHRGALDGLERLERQQLRVARDPRPRGCRSLLDPGAAAANVRVRGGRGHGRLLVRVQADVPDARYVPPARRSAPEPRCDASRTARMYVAVLSASMVVRQFGQRGQRAGLGRCRAMRRPRTNPSICGSRRASATTSPSVPRSNNAVDP